MHINSNPTHLYFVYILFGLTPLNTSLFPSQWFFPQRLYVCSLVINSSDNRYQLIIQIQTMEYLLNELTKHQYEEFNKQVYSSHPDDKTQQSCLQYFLEYKRDLVSNFQRINDDKLSSVMRCALFVAEKSQIVYNLKNQRVKGIGLSLNNFLRNSQPDDFLIVLKDFLRRVRITDKQVQTDLNNALKRVGFVLNYYGKFEKTTNKFQLKEKVNESSNYKSIMSSFMWLLFIDSKNKVLKGKQQIIENTCILAHVIAFVLSFSWEYIRPTAEYIMMKPNYPKQGAKIKEIGAFVRQVVCEQFNIKNQQSYNLMASSFENYFWQLTQSSVIKMTPGKQDFFSPPFFNTNYKKLDYNYQKALTPEHIDQRIFLKDRAANLTPSRFTPFMRIGNMNRAMKPGKIGLDQAPVQNFTSHRELNYAPLQTESQTPRNILAPSNTTNQIALPKNISSPIQKTVQLFQTPTSMCMDMNNYIYAKADLTKQSNFPNRKLDHTIKVLIQRVMQRFPGASKQMKQHTSFWFYKRISEDYIHSYPSDEKNQHQMRAILAMSLQLLIFAANADMAFEQLDKMLETKKIYLWNACDFLQKWDRDMPPGLRLHILQIQTNTISSSIWQDPNLVEQMSLTAQGQAPTPMHQKLFVRVIHQSALQIVRLMNELDIQDDQVHEDVFKTVKYVVCLYTDEMAYRHLDQMIMCSMFIVFKVREINKRFNDICTAYREIHQNIKHMVDGIISKVYKSETQRLDIMKFYNEVFRKIGDLTNNIRQIKQGALDVPRDFPSYLRTSIITAIPKEMFHLLKHKKGTRAPQTMVLSALTESPMIRQFNSVQHTGPLKSGKQINFDLEEQNMMSRGRGQIVQVEETPHDTSEFLRRNFRTAVNRPQPRP